MLNPVRNRIPLDPMFTTKPAPRGPGVDRRPINTQHHIITTIEAKLDAKAVAFDILLTVGEAIGAGLISASIVLLCVAIGGR